MAPLDFGYSVFTCGVPGNQAVRSSKALAAPGLGSFQPASWLAFSMDAEADRFPEMLQI
jgi:hypothetical protein